MENTSCIRLKERQRGPCLRGNSGTLKSCELLLLDSAEQLILHDTQLYYWTRLILFASCEARSQKAPCIVPYPWQHAPFATPARPTPHSSPQHSSTPKFILVGFLPSPFCTNATGIKKNGALPRDFCRFNKGNGGKIKRKQQKSHNGSGVHGLCDLTTVQDFRAIVSNACSYFLLYTCAQLLSVVKDKLALECAPSNKKDEEFERSGTKAKTLCLYMTCVCVCVQDEFPPEPTGAQHTQGKHHWTQSLASRYWACLSAGVYFSLPHSCFRRLWPQFHRGHLLIKGKDWNSQVLSVCSLKPRKFN